MGRRKVSTTWSRRRPNRQTRSPFDSSSVTAEFKHARGCRPAVFTFSAKFVSGQAFFLSNSCTLDRGSSLVVFPRPRVVEAVGKAVSKRVPVQLSLSAAWFLFFCFFYHVFEP